MQAVLEQSDFSAPWGAVGALKVQGVSENQRPAHAQAVKTPHKADPETSNQLFHVKPIPSLFLREGPHIGDDCPAIFRRHGVSERGVSFITKADPIKQHSVSLLLHSRGPQVGGQRGEALPHRAIAVCLGPVALDAIIPISPLSGGDRLLAWRKRTMQIIRAGLL
jgi:hypothetical protein